MILDDKEYGCKVNALTGQVGETRHSQGKQVVNQALKKKSGLESILNHIGANQPYISALDIAGKISD